MKFLFEVEKSLKNGFYLDYFFKNIVFFFYKNILGNNFMYLIDKYLAEKCFFFFRTFANYLHSYIAVIRFFNFNQVLKLMLLLIIQVVIFWVL